MTIEKTLIFLKIVIEKKGKYYLGKTYTQYKCTPYTPLTYLFILIGIPIAIWEGGYDGMKRSLKGVFKWK